jgi:molecular chaperone GrpE
VIPDEHNNPDRGQGGQPAGPVVGEEEALRAGSSSTSPSPAPPPGDAPDQDAQGAEVADDITALLAEAESQRDEYLELAKRTQADFENYRKRMAAEVQAASLRGKGQMARELIEAVDNLERALESAGEGPDGLAGGVEMVLRGMREALTRNGIEQVDPKDEKFDPNLHEALSTMPVEGAESGVVVEVMQKGYALDGHLIRPARVVVSA